MPHYFDVLDFQNFGQHFPDYGDAENRPLYFLFQMDRAHENLDATKSKFKYIDLIYTANLGNFLSDVNLGGARAFYWIAEQLHHEPRFRALMAETVLPHFAEETLAKVGENVGELVRLIKAKAEKTTNGPVSFSSKYIHFHSPVHPPFDSNAKGTISALFSTPDWRDVLGRADRETERDRITRRADLTYPELCARELELLQYAFPGQKHFINEVKHLDHYLIALFRREWPLQ